jgi:hypothetical protein
MFPAYADVPGYPLVFPLFYGALAFFLLAVGRHLRVFAQVGPSQVFDSRSLRVRGLLVYVFGQAKLFKDLRPGLMHFAIFWGFLLLSIGTADAVTGGLIQAVVSWPSDGLLWAGVTAMQNVTAVLVLGAIAYALWRRLVSKPRRLTLSRGALVILGMIGGLVAAEFVAMAFEAARAGDLPGAFISNAVGSMLRSLDGAILDLGFALSWWLHIGLVAAFLVYLPGSKHLHIATSFFNVYFRKLAPRGELPAMDLEREDQTFGVRAIADLGWKDLLDGFSCTECGRCQEACPAWMTGGDATHSPKGVGARGEQRGRRICCSALGGSPCRRRHPVRCGVGLPDLRRLCGGLSRPHRARRQDRCPAPQPRPRGRPLPVGPSGCVS